MQIVTRTFTADEFDKALLGYFQGAQKIINDYFANSISQPYKLVLTKGRRYIKIISERPSSIPGKPGSRSVFAFIDKTNGDILKPEGWNRPAMHARGNVFDADFGLQHTSWTGPNYLS